MAYVTERRCTFIGLARGGGDGGVRGWLGGWVCVWVGAGPTQEPPFKAESSWSLVLAGQQTFSGAKVSPQSPEVPIRNRKQTKGGGNKVETTFLVRAAESVC